MITGNSSFITRRGLIKRGAAGAALVSSLSFTRLAGARDGVIKIGFVSPKTGPLAGFAESDDYILAGVNAAFAEGLTVDGTTYGVEVIVKDSQSNPNRAADVAAELILDDEVKLMVVSSTPETTNPVSDQCEINGVPCISTVAPWQPWFFTRGGNPAVGFDYTYHFFWGLEDVIAVFLDMWGQIDTSKSVGGLFPNDGDGNAWGDPELGFPKPLAAAGYSLTDTGRYQNMNDDFSSQISAFKNANVDIVTGVMIPPDLPPSGTSRRSRALRRKSSRRRRPSSSPSRSKPWEMPGTISALRCGGRQTIPSSLRSTGQPRARLPQVTARQPVGSRPSRWALRTPSLRSRRMP